MLRQGIQGISDLIVTPALINLDFADVCTVMRDKGIAHMGIGRGSGERRTVEAVKQAVFSPLLETSIEGATSVILNIMGGNDLTLMEINEAADLVRQVVHPAANIIFGADIRDTLNDEILVTIIATGFEQPAGDTRVQQAPAPQPQVQNKDDFYSRLTGEQRGGADLNVFPVQPRPQPAPQQGQRPSPFGFNPQNRPQPAPQQTQRPAPSGQSIPSSHVDFDDSGFPEFLKRLNDKNRRQ